MIRPTCPICGVRVSAMTYFDETEVSLKPCGHLVKASVVLTIRTYRPPPEKIAGAWPSKPLSTDMPEVFG